jgi:hypothetical protein
MSIDLTLQVVGAEAVKVSLQTEPERIQARVRKVIAKATVEVQRNTVTYLSGPRPQNLERKSARLQRSVNQRVEEVGWEILGRVGTNVPYGADWELGFDRKVGAAARTALPSMSGETLRKYLSKHPSETRHYAARPWLRPALSDLAVGIRARITEAVYGKQAAT